MSAPDSNSPVWKAVYPVAAFFAVLPVFDLVSSVWPLQPGSAEWRYGVLGLLANAISTTLLAMLLASLAAAVLRDRTTLRVLSWAYLGVALLAVVAAGLFVLDVLQLQNAVPAQAVADYRVGAAIAVGKYALFAALVAVLALAGLRQARRLPPGKPKPGVARPAPVVGASSPEG